MDARLLLDTGPLLRLLRGHQPTVQLIRTIGRTDRLAISTVTRLEIHAGMKANETYRTQKLLSRFTPYAVDRDIADLAGDLLARQTHRITGMGVADAIIAATALTLALTLVTYHQIHFQGIPGISLYPLE